MPENAGYGPKKKKKKVGGGGGLFDSIFGKPKGGGAAGSMGNPDKNKKPKPKPLAPPKPPKTTK